MSASRAYTNAMLHGIRPHGILCEDILLAELREDWPWGVKHNDMLYGSLHGDILQKILLDNIMPAVLCECTLHLLPHAVGVLIEPGAIHTGHGWDHVFCWCCLNFSCCAVHGEVGRRVVRFSYHRDGGYGASTI